MTPDRWRFALTLFLAAYGIPSLLDPGTWRLLDAVDLAIHETGHLVFGPFGEFLAVLGGTLLQLLMPAAFVAHFLRRGDRHSASVAVWWMGQSCWNVSVYAADARAQALPLVGGGEHDWFYLLGETGLLAHDAAVGRAFWLTGVLLYAVSLWMGLTSLRQRQVVELESPGAA